MMATKNFLSRLLATGEKRGDICGRCVWCGEETEQGLDLRVSNNFTGYSWFVAGNCLCPWCYEVFDNPELRRKSWVASARGVIMLTREQIGDVMTNPPNPPWYLYISRAGKKQGWLSAARKVNCSREQYWISVEWQDLPIQANRQEVIALMALASALREVKVSKTELLSGKFGMKTWQRAIEGGYKELLRQAKAHAKRPIWEVIVYVI